MRGGSETYGHIHGHVQVYIFIDGASACRRMVEKLNAFGCIWLKNLSVAYLTIAIYVYIHKCIYIYVNISFSIYIDIDIDIYIYIYVSVARKPPPWLGSL